MPYFSLQLVYLWVIGGLRLDSLENRFIPLVPLSLFTATQPMRPCRIYNTRSRRAPVWKRLEADAWVRQGVPCHRYSFWAGHGPGAKETVGYTQCVVDREITMPPKGSEMVDPPASLLHRLTLERYRKHYPTEFKTSIRPHTSTMNQTLR